MHKHTLAPLVLTAALSACTSFAPNSSLTGQPREAVIQAMGQPHSVVSEGQGQRMVYPRGPFGKGTFFVHLDAAGRVTHWEDVLNVANFHRITPGMTTAEVENMIGPSLSKWGVWQGGQTIWDYPFHNSVCQMFQVAVTPEGRVASAGYGYAPECGSVW